MDMPSAIHDLPQDSAFGLDFNYAVWTAGTSIRLANVPWNVDYRDIVRFPTQAALDTYLNGASGPTVSMGSMTYARVGHPIRVNLPFHAVYKYNYLRASNPAQPLKQGDTGRSFYYFITDVRYIAPNTTEIQVQLDVWQTFSRDVTFGNCYIERGHIGIANSTNFDDHGRTYLTVPEGMDIGNEYIISSQLEVDLATTSTCGVMVMSTVKIASDEYGTMDAPNLISASGSSMENLPNGAELMYFHTLELYRAWQGYVSAFPWISQGVISVMAIPQIDLARFPPNARRTIALAPSVEMWDLSYIGILETVHQWPNFRDVVSLGRYANLKKFLTFPYMVVELTTYSSTPIVLKPECVNTDALNIVQMSHLAPPSPRMMFFAKGYNAAKNDTVSNRAGEFLDMATGITDFPTFSLTNSGYISFMASQRNAIAFQHSSADWSQQRALTGNQLSYDQASAGMQLQKALTNQGTDANTAQMHNSIATQGWRSLQSGLNAAVQEGMSVGKAPWQNVAGAALGGANAAADYAITANHETQQTAIQNNLARSQTSSRVQTDRYMRDTNKDYSDFAAKGDYQNSIAAINAKVQDAKMIQPTTSGQIGGDAFNLATHKWALVAKIKTLQPAVMASVGEFWLRYGYAINRFARMPASYQVMSKFTYWKLRETYITSSQCPEQYKQTLRGIFEKGVTVWSSPSDIGNIDIADNQPLTGVTL